MSYVMDRSAAENIILGRFKFRIPNRRKRECGMRFMLAPKSARAFLTAKGPIRHGRVKLPGLHLLGGVTYLARVCLMLLKKGRDKRCIYRFIIGLEVIRIGLVSAVGRIGRLLVGGGFMFSMMKNGIVNGSYEQTHKEKIDYKKANMRKLNLT
ncbi:hypothetical protein Tco_0276117 [Tanacetum coccineum]